MMRFTIPRTAALLALAVLLLGAAPAQAQPDEVLIDNSKVLGPLKRSAVAFPHGTHMAALDCLNCHHRMEKGKNTLDAGALEEKAKGVRCQDCHAVKGTRIAPDLDPTQTPLMQAFHKQCLGCHQKTAASGKKTGPRTCAGCHPVAKAKAAAKAEPKAGS